MAWLLVSGLQWHRTVLAWSGIEFCSIIFNSKELQFLKTNKPPSIISTTLIRHLSQPSFQFASPCKRKSPPDEVTHSCSPKAVHILRPAFLRFRSFSPTPRSFVERNVCEYITFFRNLLKAAYRFGCLLLLPPRLESHNIEHGARAHICRIARPHRAPYSDSKVKISLDFYRFSSLSVRV